MAEIGKGQIEIEAQPSEEYVLFGPFGEGKYTENSRLLVRKALEEQRIRPADRIAFWRRVERVLLEIKQANQDADILTRLESAVAREREAIGGATSKEAVPSAQSAFDRKRQEKYSYAQSLVSGLFNAARESGQPLPVDSLRLRLMPLVIRMSDLFSTLEDVGEMGQIPADHREILRNVISESFVGEKLNIKETLSIDTDGDIAGFLFRASAAHENTQVEVQWHQLRIQDSSPEQPLLSDLAMTMNLMLFVDKFPGVVQITRAEDGATRLEIDSVSFSHHLREMETYLHAYVMDEVIPEEGIISSQIPEQGMDYSGEQITYTCIDFIGGLERTAKKFGIQLSVETRRIVVSEFIRIIEGARLALFAMPDTESSRLKLRSLTIGVMTLKESLHGILPMVENEKGRLVLDKYGVTRAENHAFAAAITDIMQNRSAVADIAEASAQRYIDREGAKGNTIDPSRHILSQEERELIVLGRQQWEPHIDEQTRVVETFARNTVGIIQLLRILSLMERSSDSKIQQLSIIEKIQKLLQDPQQMDASVKSYAESGSRGSHSGWYTTALMMGREEVAQAILTDQSEAAIQESDWLQVRAAAEHLLTYIAEDDNLNENTDLNTLLGLLKNRTYLVGAAQFTDQAYRKQQKKAYEEKGQTPPEWLSQATFSPESLALISKPGVGVSESDVNTARIKYAQNAISFAALQEGILDLARIQKRAAADILDLIISDHMPSADKAFLSSLQKAAYLQLQMFRGRIDSPTSTIDVLSLKGDMEDPNVQTDWALLRESAVLFRSYLPEGAFSAQAATVDFSPQLLRDRQAGIVESTTPPELLSRMLDKMSIRTPDTVLLFSGGASFMEAENGQAIIAKVAEQIRTPLENGKKVLVINGGVNQGFMGQVGQASQQVFFEQQGTGSLQVLGISEVGLIAFNPDNVATQNYGAPYPPAVGNTHFLLVSDHSQGKMKDEGDVITQLRKPVQVWERLVETHANAADKRAFVANGGKGTAVEVRAFIENNIPITLIKGQERLSFLLEAALQTVDLESYRAFVSANAMDKKTMQEVDNIFYLLRPDDLGVEMQVGKDNKQQPAANEQNFKQVKEILQKSTITMMEV